MVADRFSDHRWTARAVLLPVVGWPVCDSSALGDSGSDPIGYKEDGVANSRDDYWHHFYRHGGRGTTFGSCQFNQVGCWCNGVDRWSVVHWYHIVGDGEEKAKCFQGTTFSHCCVSGR